MIQIAADLAKLYTSFMEQKGLETDQHRYYIKWLRYYLDFCHKYKFKRQNRLLFFTHPEFGSTIVQDKW